MVPVREYTPEQAGMRIGWAALEPRNEEGWYMGAHLASATVGAEGAYMAYELREEDGEVTKQRGWSDGMKGFEAVQGLSVFFDTRVAPDEQDYKEFHIARSERFRRDSGQFALNHGGDSHTNAEVIAEQRRWADSPVELMAHMKAVMEERGLGEHYPLVYYTANLMVAHEMQREQSSLCKVPVEVTLMPDATMSLMTEEQIAHAEEIIRQLEFQKAGNVEMTRNLTVFSDLSPESLPDAFIESRRAAAEAEVAVQAANRQLLTYGGIHLATQHALTWPYMDAGESDEGKAFGGELRHLEAKNTEVANASLRYELKGLEQRLQHARRGRVVLGMLLSAERSN
jgi:hypothetical protein